MAARDEAPYEAPLAHPRGEIEKRTRLMAEDLEWICPSLNPQAFDTAQALGMATWLWIHSPLHREWSASLLGAMVWPAIHHRQFLIARGPGREPVAYVSWACFDESREQKYLRDPSSIVLDDWQCGDRLWFIDWVTPFGGTSAVARKIESDIFPDAVGHSLRVKKGRDTALVCEHFGKNATLERKKTVAQKLRQNIVAAFANKYWLQKNCSAAQKIS